MEGDNDEAIERGDDDNDIEDGMREGFQNSGYCQKIGSLEIGDSPTSRRRCNLRVLSMMIQVQMNFSCKGGCDVTLLLLYVVSCVVCQLECNAYRCKIK